MFLFQVVFRPPLDVYDVLIHLRPQQVPLLSRAVDPPKTTGRQGTLDGDAASSGGAFPVVDFDPVKLYLSELRVGSLQSFILHGSFGKQPGMVLINQNNC